MAEKSVDYVVYAVREREGNKNIWTRIGAAFKHDKAEGLTIYLDALPVGRKIVLMPPKEAEE